MFKRKRKAVGRNGLTAFIDEGSEIEGRYTFSGTVMVNGRFKGEISSTDTLIIGDKGVINGDIRAGQVLIIPLELAVTPGPTPTPTQPPPYPAPNQLLPNDGAGFTLLDQTVALQWASVGELRVGELYQVILEDVTCNCAAVYTWTTTETKWIVPVDVRPKDAAVHTFRWRVTTVRQRNPDGGQPAFDPAGASSPDRVFSWLGGASTPAP